VDTNEDWKQWVSDKVYGTKNAKVTANRFTLRDIEYKKVQSITEIRGERFDGIIEHETALLNPEYSDIKKCIMPTLQ
jgi:hypothetical protein